MKRVLVLSVLFGLLTLAVLSACAPKSAAGGPTPAATDLVYAVPDRGMATPVFGTAQLPKGQGLGPLQLHSRPAPGAPVSGQVFSGAEGVVLGTDATQKWVLVKFDDQVGWAPVAALALTIAQ